MFQFGPAHVFQEAYRRELEQSDNVTLCTYATALELETDDLAQQVTRIRIGTPAGNQFWLETKLVSLATGGIEAARLLLLSNAVQKSGLGNGHDLVGRYLMDHPVIRSGLLVPPNRRVINRMSLYDMRFVGGHLITAKAALSEETLRKEQLLNICAAFFPRPASHQLNLLRLLLPKGRRYRSPTVGAAIRAKAALKARKAPPLKDIKDLITGWQDLLYFQWRKGYSDRAKQTYHFDNGGWSERADKEKAFGCYEIIHLTEQAPDPQNRIVLSGDRDRFGSPKPQLYWRWSDQDVQSVRRAQTIFAQEFARSGLGQLKLELDQGFPYMVYPSIHHHIGTTRMHESPTQGVVDANCQVHGVSNLYIASSSVFPTSGYANPTLTIVAIALRVADQIKLKMAQRNSSVTVSAPSHPQA